VIIMKILFLLDGTGNHQQALECVKLLVLVSSKRLESLKKEWYLYLQKDKDGEAPLDIAIKHGSTKITAVFMAANEGPALWYVFFYCSTTLLYCTRLI